MRTLDNLYKLIALTFECFERKEVPIMCEETMTIRNPTEENVKEHYSREELEKELKNYSEPGMLLDFVSILQEKVWNAGYFYCKESKEYRGSWEKK